MTQLDDQARKWLESHKHELESEEILFEEEKQQAALSVWPVPIKVSNMGVLENIDSTDSFNRIIGDPENWEEILNNKDLYNKWILPNAVLLFGKQWFNRVKFKKNISSGIPFGLFEDEDVRICSKNNIDIESTIAGKSRIIKLASSVSKALITYLEGNLKLYKENKLDDKFKSVRNSPGGYIIETIKNDAARDIGKDRGYKFESVPACPYCLTKSKKSILTRVIKNIYSCSRCKEVSRNIDLNVKSLYDRLEISSAEELRQKHLGVNDFVHFHGATCVCPNNTCPGKFVPITSTTNESFLKTINNYDSIKGVSVFKTPPRQLRNIPLKCPYCRQNFTPKDALIQKSGFKNMSGHFTGLPVMYIWNQISKKSIDDTDSSLNHLKGILVSTTQDVYGNIAYKQKVNILIEELLINMSKLNLKTKTGLLSWYFYQSAINWMATYWKDAARYFFGKNERERVMTEKEKERYPGQTHKKVTDVLRGQEVAIHQSFFTMWLDLLEENIDSFTMIDSKIKDLKDFRWFCQRPKFSSGPRSTFFAVVDSNFKVRNESSIVPSSPKRPKPRIARLYSIYKVVDDAPDLSQNLIGCVRSVEWQAIKMNRSDVCPGDRVQVDALMMPGHPTHAPIQRIIRLRKRTLSPIINRIIKEEESSNIDNEFWKARKRQVDIAKLKIGEMNANAREE